MPTRVIKPDAPPLDIRCNVGDVMVANLAVSIVFFFERRLDEPALRAAFGRALTSLPVFAGRMAMVDGAMRIRCHGQGVPFTSGSSGRTLCEAIRSTSQGGGRWLVDPVHGAIARWGLGPLCTVRVTHLADGATAIGFSWHHAIGDMQTAMSVLSAWAAAAAGGPVAEPLLVADRAAYLDEHLPAGGAQTPGVRCLGLSELGRSAMYLAKDARKQRVLSTYFGAEELARMRAAAELRVTANDVVCAHVCEVLMATDPTVDRRTLAIAVNARTHCGLDPGLVGNVITTLNIDLRRGEAASSIARRIRQAVDRFADEHCDLRINQQFLDAAGRWGAAWCVSSAFALDPWNPVISNWSGFGLYRLQFEDTAPCYCAPLMKLPFAGLGALVDGVGGRGLVLQIALPPKAFEAMTTPSMQARLRGFRHDGDDIPRVHRELHG